MKEVAPFGNVPVPVDHVADDRVSDRREMRSDLVHAACRNLRLEKGYLASCGKRPIAGERHLGARRAFAIAEHEHLATTAWVRGDQPADLTRAGDCTAYDRDVALLDRSLAKLPAKRAPVFLAPCCEDDPRGRGVEAVHQAGFERRAAGGHTLREACGEKVGDG